jgi:hypothetical protein
MIKICQASGWDFETTTTALVKVARDGRLYPNDRKEFIKRASGSENIFLPFLDKIKLASDETLTHHIALGAVEKWGCNRNGDGFTKVALLKSYKTFEKHGRPYRNHKNTPQDPAYGVIKCAAYNDKMDRVELLVAYNNTKEAAERNKGYVADKELEKLAKGEDIPVSMACRVPYDRCSYCGNLAKTREDYCTREKCAAGGCAKNLAKLVKVGSSVHHLFVYNDDPVFFDISHVFRPADPTAYSTKADWFTKKAEYLSEQLTNNSYLLGDCLTKTAETLTPKQQDVFHLLTQLSKIENTPKAQCPARIKLAFTPAVQNLERFKDNTTLSRVIKKDEIHLMLNKLAQENIIVPFRVYAELFNKGHLVKKAEKYLPFVFTHVLNQYAQDGFLLKQAVEKPLYHLDTALQMTTQNLKPAFSMDKPYVERRIVQGSLYQAQYPDLFNVKYKFAADVSDQETYKTCLDYGLYKLASIYKIGLLGKDLVLTSLFSQCQNSVN